MKMARALILCGLVFALSVPAAAAAAGNSSAAASASSETAKVLQMVRQNTLTMSWDGVLPSNLQEQLMAALPNVSTQDGTVNSINEHTDSLARAAGFDLNSIYMFYPLNTHFISDYEKTKSFDEEMGNDWYYEAKSDYANVDFTEQSGKINVKGAVECTEPSGQLPSPDALAKQIANQVPNVTSVRLCFSEQASLYVVFIKAGSNERTNEYAIPYNSSNLFRTSPENGKVYTVASMISILEKSPIPAQPSVIANPGYPIYVNPLLLLSPWQQAAAIACVLVILAAVTVAIVFLVKRLRRNRTKTERGQ